MIFLNLIVKYETIQIKLIFKKSLKAIKYGYLKYVFIL